MIQQINLYQPPEQQVRQSFSAVNMVIIWTALVVLLGMTQVWQSYRATEISRDQIRLQGHEKQLSESVEKIQTLLEKRVPDPALGKAVKKASKNLAQRRQTLVVVQRVTRRNRGLFSRQLTGLGEQRMAGLWLTRVHLAAQRGLVQITGKANDPELVSRYIEFLGEHPDLAGVKFNAVEVSGGDPGVVDFRFGTLPKRKSAQ